MYSLLSWDDVCRQPITCLLTPVSSTLWPFPAFSHAFISQSVRHCAPFLFFHMLLSSGMFGTVAIFRILTCLLTPVNSALWPFPAFSHAFCPLPVRHCAHFSHFHMSSDSCRFGTVASFRIFTCLWHPVRSALCPIPGLSPVLNSNLPVFPN